MRDTTEYNKNRLMSESDYIVNRRSIPGALCEGQAKGWEGRIEKLQR